MFKIYKMNSLPTTGLEEGNIYYVINPNNADSMDVYVVDNTLQLNKISTTNGTEISFDDSSTIDEEITNIYDEHSWIDYNTSSRNFVDIWRGSYSSYLELSEEEKSKMTRILITY